VRDSLVEQEERRDRMNVDKLEMQAELELNERDMQQLNAEFEECVARIKAFQAEVDDLRSLCNTIQDKICGHRHDLHFSNGGRTSLVDQFTQLERKYQQTLDNTQWDMNELKYRHRRRVKLISVCLLFRKISMIAQHKRYTPAFQRVKQHARVRAAYTQGLLRVRRLIKQNR
jgi:hypothetical protein